MPEPDSYSVADPATRDRPLALLTTVSSDAHTWNLIYLQLLLREQGFAVVNLGPCAPHSLIVDSIVSLRPDVVVVSTVNGHGSTQAESLMTAVRKALPAGERPAIAIGGKLTTSDSYNDRTKERLLRAGFDAVFPSAAGIEEFHPWLAERKRTRSVLRLTARDATVATQGAAGFDKRSVG